MRNVLVLALLALGIAAAAVAASVLLVGSTRANDRVGNLSPVGSVATTPAPAATARERPGAEAHDGEDD